MRLSRKKEAGLDHGLEATNSVEAKEFPEDRYFSFVFNRTFSRSSRSGGPVRLSRKKEAGFDHGLEATNSVEAKEFPEDRAFLFFFFYFCLF